MGTLASAMRRKNRRSKAPSSSSTAAALVSGRVPLIMAFLSCLARLYVVGRLWQDAQTRAILLEKGRSGSVPKVLSVEDMLRNPRCKAIGRQIVEAEMDLAKAKSEGHLWGNRTAAVDSDEKQKLLAVIGVYNGFGSHRKRNAFRGSWMPRGDALKKLEEKGVVIRFVIGRSANPGDSLDRNIDDENRQTKDFLLLESHEEVKEELPSKVKFFFSAAFETWDAEFYVKVEDNINLDLAGLIEMLEGRRGSQGLYMGCMKSGVVIKNEYVLSLLRGDAAVHSLLPRRWQEWHEPDWWKFGDSNSYFRHASGSLLILSKNLARYININSASLQSYAHDNISVGSWMMGLNATYVDDDRLCCSSSRQDKRSTVIRASDDFWPRDPASHTIHIASVAYNTVFLGEFMQPDWDMFHSVHPMAEYHAAARAVGGCAIYVSDKPGNHDFNLLKKLVLPDGSILRAKFPGRPTRDCLFSDPARDGKSILKIWNLNEHSGVIGAFNCQGAGWCQVGKKNLIHDEQPGTVTGVIRAQDVACLAKVADHSWNGDVIVYSHIGGEVVYLPKNASLPVTLRSREYEVFTVVPLKHLPNGASFTPIGLVGMFNSGGAVREVRFGEDSDIVELKMRGSGMVGAYSSTKPKSVAVDAKAVRFSYDDACGLLTFELGLPKQELYLWTVSVEY